MKLGFISLFNAIDLQSYHCIGSSEEECIECSTSALSDFDEDTGYGSCLCDSHYFFTTADPNYCESCHYSWLELFTKKIIFFFFFFLVIHAMELAKIIVCNVGMMQFIIQYSKLVLALDIMLDLLIRQELVIITTELLIIITKVGNAFIYVIVAQLHKVKNA